jgi:SAM-dependent methyltransferase
VFLVESDPRKVAVATRACAGTSVNVEAADLSRGPAEAVEAALLADVLHYFPREQQQPLLRAVCDALRPGGILIVRDTDARGLGGTVTRGLEAMAMAGGWNRGAPKPDYPSLASLQRFLGETLGFTVETQSASSLLHGGNFLLVARKGRSGPAQGG